MAATLVVVLAGCTQAQLQGWLPGNADTTNETGDIMALWFTSWVILLVVGLVTWILIIWAAVMYRRRKGQTGLPIQLRYNLPIEIFYTVVPLILVLGFFAFTARTQNVLEARFDEPEVKIEAYGKRWAWDFNYLGGQTEDGQVVEGDSTVDFGGVEVVVDKMSVPYLDGASIDFEDTIQKQGFTIDNPNAGGSCACGDSFH